MLKRGRIQRWSLRLVMAAAAVLAFGGEMSPSYGQSVCDTDVAREHGQAATVTDNAPNVRCGPSANASRDGSILIAFSALAVPAFLRLHAGVQGTKEVLAAKSPNPAASNSFTVADVAPSAENTLLLIRSTLLSLNDGLQTGNYTVLRDLAAPSFREANTAGRLYQIFSDLAAKGNDLSAVAIMVPKLPKAAMIDQNKRLLIGGHFPGQPMQINFEMQFEAVGGRWRLFSIFINAHPSPRPPAAPPAADGPPEGRPAGRVEIRYALGPPGSIVRAPWDCCPYKAAVPGVIDL